MLKSSPQRRGRSTRQPPEVPGNGRRGVPAGETGGPWTRAEHRRTPSRSRLRALSRSPGRGACATAFVPGAAPARDGRSTRAGLLGSRGESVRPGRCAGPARGPPRIPGSRRSGAGEAQNKRRVGAASKSVTDSTKRSPGLHTCQHCKCTKVLLSFLSLKVNCKSAHRFHPPRVLLHPAPSIPLPTLHAGPVAFRQARPSSPEPWMTRPGRKPAPALRRPPDFVLMAWR